MRHIITRSFFYVVIFLVIFTTVLTTYFFYRKAQFSDKVYPNVLVNGASFEGMTKREIQKFYEPINQSLQNKQITLTYKESIATFSGELLKLSYNDDVIQDQAYLIGRSSNTSSRFAQQFAALFNLRTYALTYTPSYDTSPIDAYLDELDETYSIKAKDALFEMKDGRVIAFKPEESGREVQTSKARSALMNYMSTIVSSPQHFVLEVIDQEIKPEITLSNVNTLGIVEKIAEGNSNYTGSSAERAFNVVHASRRFHGVLIPPNEVLSYNAIIGDISQATGFKPAYVIKNGRTVLGDGGGVCQDSTTLFRAALNAGLPIIERKAHAYRVKYYENDRKPGFDATVFSPSVDFKFKNDTGTHILIQTVLNEATRSLTFEFWGKKDGRIVELSDATVYDHRPAPEPLYQDDPSLPKGTTKQVDWAAPGAKSVFSYKVTRNGEILQDEKFYSNYRPWQAVYLVGTL